MLTIENTYKLMGRSITIKGHPFRIQTIIEMPFDYTIGIEDYSTAHAPMTVLLHREANKEDRMYGLVKIGNYPTEYVKAEMIENANDFLFVLQMYLNSL